jgi:thermitase
MSTMKNLLLAVLISTSFIGQVQASYQNKKITNKFSSWGIDPKEGNASINLPGLWKKFTKKKEIVVAVIDTGIQHDHPFLKDNIYVVEGRASRRNYGVDFSTPRPSMKPIDSHGHGTHVAGIIKSVFPDVKLLALKYYNPQASGQANLNSTIKALEYAVDQNVDIINYSGGGPEPSLEELKVLRKAEAKGILVVAAAGNEKSNIDDKKYAYYPASYGLDNIISVSAHDQNVKIIQSSNWGKLSVDVAAPGYRIKSAIPQGQAGFMTGTSQATAFVTGIAAMIKSNFPELAYDDIKNAIIASSVKAKGLRGKILGGGKVDATSAFKTAERAHKFLMKESGRALAKKK